MNFKEMIEDAPRADFKMQLENISKEDILKEYENLFFQNMKLDDRNLELSEKIGVLEDTIERLELSLLLGAS